MRPLPEIRRHSETEVILPAGNANLYSFLVFVIVVFAYGVPFAMMFGVSKLWLGAVNFLTRWELLVPSIFGGMILHELLHAVIFALFCQHGWRSVSFGVNWRQLAPYVHCQEPLNVWPYRMATAMPGIALGIMPAAIALMTGSASLAVFGMFFTAGAAADAYCLVKLAHVSTDYLVRDHPHQVGFFLVSKKQ